MGKKGNTGQHTAESPFPVVPIAHIRTCFKEKFGTPRQAGLIPSARGEIVFEPACRHPEAFRGLENFSHLWLIFLFDKSADQGWRPTVRPPRLGGNERMGVFATRSPFRPNPIGLSAVRLESIDYTHEQGPVLHVLGADIVDGTPVLDIKPYIPYADSIPDAAGGFARETPNPVPVHIPGDLAGSLPPDWLDIITQTLSADPRPAYHNDSGRIYGLLLGGYDIHWQFREEAIHVVSLNKTDTGQ